MATGHRATLGEGGGWGRVAPWALSGLVHAGLIGMGFTVVWSVSAQRDEDEDRPRIVVEFDDPGPAAAAAGVAVAVAEGDEGSVAAKSGEVARLPETPAALSLSELLAKLLPAGGGEEMERAAGSVEESGLAQSRRLPDVMFAGSGASNARSVVYVVDASGSTVSTFPMIRSELRRSLVKLGPTQQFQVIFFGPGRGGYLAAEHPSDREAGREGGGGGGGVRTIRLIRATGGNVEGVLGWVESVTPSHRSNPIAALEMALGLKPDAVFVLSTAITGLGVWEPDRAALLAQIDALNPVKASSGRRGVVIKTIQMMEDDPAGILRAIGEAHGGKDGYKFLSRREVTGP